LCRSDQAMVTCDSSLVTRDLKREISMTVADETDEKGMIEMLMLEMADSEPERASSSPESSGLLLQDNFTT
jgi:hypothetical protein